MPDVVTAPIRRATPLDALYEAVRELAGLSDPAVVFERAVTLLPIWLDANEGALALWNAHTGALEVVAAAGVAMVPTIGQRCDLSGVLGRSFADGVSMRVDDYRTFVDVDPSGVARGVRCVASAPLLTRDGPCGALIVQRCGDSDQAFREDDMRLLTIVAALVTAAWRETDPTTRIPNESVGEGAAQLQFVLESAGAIIFSFDIEGRITQASGAFVRLLGYHLEELLTFSVFDLIAPGDRDVVAKHVQGRVEGGDTSTYELDVKTKQGTTVPLMVRSVTLRDAEGSAIGGTGLCFDISMRKDLEQRLIEGEKLRALGQLAAGVAHDVNNSLAAIIGPSELLLESLRQGVASAAEFLTDLTMIRQAATDAAATVRRLQIFARASGEQSVVRKEPIAPHLILHDVAAMTRPRWRDQALREGRHIALRIEASETMPTVLAEPAQLREVLTNLIHNAIDALPTGGSITLSAETRHDAVVLRVKDNGTGMTPEVRRRLFEPFFTTKDVGHGTGLGLATSYGIVRSLGGTIEVETRPKRGTTMIVTLPLIRDETAVTPAPWVAVTNSLRILFVEDERVLRDIGERLLKREGHAVVSAATAEEALELYEPGRFDLVLTDVGLPGVSGHVLIARIRALDPSQCIGIASGWGASLNEGDLESSGITHDLIASKPYRLDDLRRLLAAAASVIGTSEAPRQL